MTTPHHPPKTPTTPSIRNFMTRTSAITPTTLASTYRRNSRCPHPPTSSPIDTGINDIDIDIKTPTASSIPSSFQPRGNIMTTTPRSINQIATYLKSNYGTPTKSKYYSGIKNLQQDPKPIEEYGYKTPVQKGRENVDRELERSTSGFTPIVPLPSSVTIRKRRGSPGSCFSGGGSSASGSVGRRRDRFDESGNKRGFYDEEGIPSISDSMEELPDHPVYKFRRTSGSGGGGRNVSGEKDVEMGDVKDIETSEFKDIIKRPSTSSSSTTSSTSSTSSDQKSDPSLATSTPSPIFHSPTPNTGITNKENIDPITLTPSSSESSSSPSSIIFNTPTSHTPDPTRHLLLYDQSRQKDIFSKKKLEAIKNSSSEIPHSSYTYTPPSSSVIKPTSPFVIPNNTMGWGICPPSPSNPQDTSTLPDNITPTPTPSSNSNIPTTIKRHRSSSTGTPQTHITFPSSSSRIPQKTGLISKLGLQNKTSSTTSSTGPKIPVTPTPQKLLHKSAKSTTSHNYHYNYTSSSSSSYHQPQTPTPTPSLSLSTRNSKKLEDLKMRFPRSMYPLNGRKKSNITNNTDLLKLARGESTLNHLNGVSSGNEPDSNEWTDRDIQRFEFEKGRLYPTHGEDVEMEMVDAELGGLN
ncbi:hypothetical protein TWF970_002791 [Orbilia oligospora]|uniref:Uncharacterized protein n=1 Tax=Orbilia oligospora TaxID=2813651 RepID=A0A7C8VP44_ORBOL|nr:hypothetical protein TWF970_002791 [Orbilia oligospora]